MKKSNQKKEKYKNDDASPLSSLNSGWSSINDAGDAHVPLARRTSETVVMAVSASLHDLSSNILSVLVMLLLAHHLLLLLVAGHLSPHHLQLVCLAISVKATVSVRADAEVLPVQVFNPDRAVVGVRRGCILAVVRGGEASTTGTGTSCRLQVLETASENLFKLDLVPSI
jgi:hypothetical protein